MNWIFITTQRFGPVAVLFLTWVLATAPQIHSKASAFLPDQARDPSGFEQPAPQGIDWLLNEYAMPESDSAGAITITRQPPETDTLYSSGLCLKDIGFGFNAEGNHLTYQWQESVPEQDEWYDITGQTGLYGEYSGWDTDSLSILGAFEFFTLFRCRISDTSGESVFTDSSMLVRIICGSCQILAINRVYHVYPLGSVSIGTEVIDCRGYPTETDIAYRYQWQCSKDSGQSWHTISDAGDSPGYNGWNTNTLQLDSIEKNISGYQYRAVVYSCCHGYDTSSSTMLYVKSLINEKYNLHSFSGHDGADPIFSGPLISDSVIYGMTTRGGNENMGVIYRVKQDGTGFTKIIDFIGTNGSHGIGMLRREGNWLYGVAEKGGKYDKGVIFRVDTSGKDFTLLHEFSGSDGSHPMDIILVEGILYGATEHGGVNNYGVLYRLNPENFDAYSLAVSEADSLENAINDFRINADDPLIDSFLVKLLRSLDLYSGGMTNAEAKTKLGVFSDSIEVFTVLHKFTYAKGETFLSPAGSGIIGVTIDGGEISSGTIFRIDLDGSSFSVVHYFQGSDGRYPLGPPVCHEGKCFGTTYSGTFRTGVLYTIREDGSDFSVLHHFSTVEGRNPVGSVAIEENWIYGTTLNGGENNKGVIFAVGTNGVNYNVLFNFDTINGAAPEGTIVKYGNCIIGMTKDGGRNEKGNIYSFPIPELKKRPDLYDSICQHETAEFGFKAAYPVQQYQWQVRYGVDWLDITQPGNFPEYRDWNTDTLRILNAARSAYFRCKLTDSTGRVSLSEKFYLNVKQATEILKMPGNITACEGVVSGTGVIASGEDISYQWEVNTGDHWDKITDGDKYSGSGEDSLAFTADREMNGYTYRCLISAKCKSIDTSNAILLQVYTEPEIDSHPVGDTISEGGNSGFGIRAKGQDLTYQWQLSRDEGGSWNDIDSAGINPVHSGWNTDSIEIHDVSAENDGLMYRCLVSGICGPDSISSPAVIHLPRKTDIVNLLKAGIELFPVPATTNLEIRIPASSGDLMEISVYNAQGQAVLRSREPRQTENNTYLLSLAGLVNGIYHINLNIDGRIHNAGSFVKVHR